MRSVTFPTQKNLSFQPKVFYLRNRVRPTVAKTLQLRLGIFPLFNSAGRDGRPDLKNKFLSLNFK